MLKISKIKKSYPLPSGDNRTILNEIDLLVESGERIAIVGPSGSGKSTLLNLIGALDRPDSGDIWFDGDPLFKKTTEELSLFRNKSIGFIFQLHHLLPQFSLIDNVLLPLLAHQQKITASDASRAENLLEKLGVLHVKNQKPGQLSGGECQRAAVARALVNQPRLLLADEPTGALDHQNALAMGNLLATINAELGTSLIVVTHSMELAQNMDKIYHLADGKLALQ